MLDLLKEILKQSNIYIRSIHEAEFGFVVNNDFLVKKSFLITNKFKDEIIAEIISVKNKKLAQWSTRSFK